MRILKGKGKTKELKQWILLMIDINISGTTGIWNNP